MKNDEEMRGLSIRQPWATMIADGRKTLEIRSRPTRPRANVILCSSAKPAIFPAGFALAIIDIVDCRPFEIADEDLACVAFRPNEYAWVVSNVRRLNPYPIKGQLGFFRIAPPLDLREG